MIEINLLPEEFRKKESPFKLNLDIDRFKVWIAGGIGAILVLLIIFLSLGLFIRKFQINKLLTKEKGFSYRLSQIEGVNKEISVLKVKMSVLDELTKRRFLWARKLNQLSDLMLPGIWLTHVYTDSENRFMIEGSVISKSEEEMASVGKFMKNIKEDVEFFKDFRNIKLESVQRNNRNNMDIVDFKIALYF
jgi:Tfp pilus assembly protein PilN